MSRWGKVQREGAANERGSGEEEEGTRTSSRGGNELQIAAMFARRVTESKMDGRKSTLPIMGRFRAEEADCYRFSLGVFSCVAGDVTRLLPSLRLNWTDETSHSIRRESGRREEKSAEQADFLFVLVLHFGS